MAVMKQCSVCGLYCNNLKLHDCVGVWVNRLEPKSKETRNGKSIRTNDAVHEKE